MRMALGAPRSSVVRMIVRQGLTPVTIGLALRSRRRAGDDARGRAPAVRGRADRSDHLRRGDRACSRRWRRSRASRRRGARRRSIRCGRCAPTSVKWPRPCGLSASAHAETRGAQLLADAESGGALGVPRAAVLLRVARRQGPLQADGARRGVGRHPAADDDVRVHASSSASFGGMSKQVEGPYALHVFVGMLPWTFFANAVALAVEQPRSAAVT